MSRISEVLKEDLNRYSLFEKDRHGNTEWDVFVDRKEHKHLWRYQIMKDSVFRCERCSVVSCSNEAVWNNYGDRICLHCSPKGEIAFVSNWLKNNEEKYAEIESRFEILDL